MSEVTITVRGEHEVRIAPEEAVANLSVRIEGPERADVIERMAAVASPLRDDLSARKDAGGISEWSSQRMSVWASRPWNNEGRQLALVHYASLEVTATFTDFTALSDWIGDVAEREGVQVDGVHWRLTPQTAKAAEAEAATHAVKVAVDRATAYAGALGLAALTPLEIADLGLLTRAPEPAAPPPRMLRAMSASPLNDSAPAVDFQPEDIVVTAAVEARFSAR